MKKKNRILTVMAILCVLSVSAAAVAVIVMRNRPATGQPPAYYLDEEEQLSSVTAIVGDRPYVRLDEPSAPDTAVSGNTIASAGSNYLYYPLSQVDEDVSQYISYLTTQKRFIDITDLDSQTIPATEEEQTDAADPSANDLPDEEASHIYCFAGPSQDPDAYLQVTIQAYPDRYFIAVQKEEEPWDTYVAALWEDINSQKQELEQEQASLMEQKQIQATNQANAGQPSLALAEQTVEEADPQTLGLSGDMDQYTFIANRGQVLIDNKDYYQVNAYLRNKNGTLDYACTFLYDVASGKIAYKYDSSPDQLVALGN